MKKTIKLINNERLNTKLTSQKACLADSYDYCSGGIDIYACMSNSYDVCNKDYASCSGESYDLCEQTDLDVCIAGGRDVD